ncbi:MAG: HAMP domain-containing protein [Coriobacteriaceae bacterium]|nr:HAMP domain-containing protein [Coriobacteriaceae bacterium]
MAESEKTGRRLGELVWGRMADAGRPMRIVSLVFVLVAIVSMSFCQLGFWSIGDIDEKPVYLILILAPLMMGAFMFGPIVGGLLGFFTGAVLYIHAAAFPLDFYEIYFMTPLNTFLLFTFLGAVSGFLFTFASRKVRGGRQRVAFIVAACVLLSFAASGLIMVNTVVVYGGDNIDAIRKYLFNSPLGVVVQALVDAFLAAVLCLISSNVVRKAKMQGSDRKLLSIFRNWLALIASIVFMLSAAIIFSVSTATAQSVANNDMLSDIDYLKRQLESPGGGTCEVLLNGYKVELDGSVAITDESGIILATDDPETYPKGAQIVRQLGYDTEEHEDGSSAGILGEIARSDSMQVLQEVDKSGVMTMEFAFVAVASYDGGYVVTVRTPEKVYASRFGTMFASSSLAFALIVAISILATALLSRVVVRRIGETNGSLEKITEGDLNERVDVRDTREFSSLSAGINATVTALKDTIDEVKQHNAQELTAAKAIQESALPTEFPAFPDIDKFDIYASMKTAKEVGGDFYDFFLIEGSSKLGIVMADVSGKGIPASLFMMAAKTQIRNYMEADLPLGEAIDAANHQLCIGNDAGMFVTVWVAELDYETGVLTYVNGGHNPPLLLHDGAWEWERDVSGMPLGLFDGIPYESFQKQLVPGDMLYTYTDGVSEAMNSDGELFGEGRLEDTLRLHSDLNPRSLCVAMRRAITDFTLDCEQSDDITMLALKYGVPPATTAVMVLPARTDQLVHVCNYIHAELHRRHAPSSVYNPLDIAAEELFVNVCHYAYPDATPENPGEARVSFEYAANPPSLTVQIVDDGVPYNPLAKPDAVTPDDIMEVPIGGLGILMAKKSVDDMTYERVGDSNVLTFRKGW